jgi:hypothetical protein
VIIFSVAGLSIGLEGVSIIDRYSKKRWIKLKTAMTQTIDIPSPNQTW